MTSVHAVGDLEITVYWEEDISSPVELHIRAPRGVTYKDFRAISFTRMTPPLTPLPEGILGDMTAVGDWLHENAPGTGGRRHKLNDLFLANVALFYTLSLRAGDSDPVACMANYSRVKPTTAQWWVKHSRGEGFLTTSSAPRKGRPFGKLTEKALELIK